MTRKSLVPETFQLILVITLVISYQEVVMINSWLYCHFIFCVFKSRKFIPKYVGKGLRGFFMAIPSRYYADPIP